MAKRTQSAEKPARKQHPARMGCLVMLGVSLLVLVSTAFAPDRAPDDAAPAATRPSNTSAPGSTLTLTRTPVPTPTERPLTPTVLPSATAVETTQLATESANAEQPAASTRVLAEATETQQPVTPPTRTPTTALLFATNTPVPLVILTNTPASDDR